VTYCTLRKAKRIINTAPLYEITAALPFYIRPLKTAEGEGYLTGYIGLLVSWETQKLTNGD